MAQRHEPVFKPGTRLRAISTRPKQRPSKHRQYSLPARRNGRSPAKHLQERNAKHEERPLRVRHGTLASVVAGSPGGGSQPLLPLEASEASLAGRVQQDDVHR